MKKIVECEMKGMLSFLLLSIISKKPSSGYEIALELEKRKGCKPSPGTIYPALKHLNEQGLIKEEKSGKIITYTLTNTGKTSLREAKTKFKKMFSGLI